MSAPALKDRLRQEAMAVRGQANPTGKILFVNSANGADGNSGLD